MVAAVHKRARLSFSARRMAARPGRRLQRSLGTTSASKITSDGPSTSTVTPLSSGHLRTTRSSPTRARPMCFARRTAARAGLKRPSSQRTTPPQTTGWASQFRLPGALLSLGRTATQKVLPMCGIRRTARPGPAKRNLSRAISRTATTSASPSRLVPTSSSSGRKATATWALIRARHTSSISPRRTVGPRPSHPRPLPRRPRSPSRPRSASPRPVTAS
mmetsp:Transcript_5568/g.18947  ORF Transcript_5568/g.18947 Transcript_5568/m.18947 type:complete len:218 (+) Transcript_5568:449-1102(+)